MEPPTVHELTAAYAMDALDEREQREYEAHLGHCERCREELAWLSETANALAYAVEGPEPPAGLRDRILDQARAERPNVVPLRRRWALPAVASVAAVAACAAIGLGIWAGSLSRSLDNERSARGRDTEALRVVSDPAARRVPLSDGRGTLVVAPDGSAALVVSRLQRAPSGKAYEAWVIRGQRPVAAGLFAGGRDAEAVALRERVPRGSTVAVTLERAAGVDAPTGKPLFTASA
jgi:anti-sigma factor RsiW